MSVAHPIQGSDLSQRMNNNGDSASNISVPQSSQNDRGPTDLSHEVSKLPPWAQIVLLVLYTYAVRMISKKIIYEIDWVLTWHFQYDLSSTIFRTTYSWTDALIVYIVMKALSLWMGRMVSRSKRSENIRRFVALPWSSFIPGVLALILIHYFIARIMAHWVDPIFFSMVGIFPPTNLYLKIFCLQAAAAIIPLAIAALHLEWLTRP